MTNPKEFSCKYIGRREFIKNMLLCMVGAGALSTIPGCSPKLVRSGEPSKAAMRYRKLGRTGIKVSEIGLGGHFDGPGWREKHSKEQRMREAIFKEAVKAGINFFDTNSDPERESLGPIFKTYPELRKKTYIVTDINDRKETYQETKIFIKERFYQQLAIWQQDYVDILRFSSVVKRTPPERLKGVIEAFQELRADGKVRFLAVSQHDPNLLLEQINTWNEIDIIYTPYSFQAPRAAERLLPAAKAKNIGTIAIKPFNKGTMFNPELLERHDWGSGMRSIVAMVKEGQKSPQELMKASNLTAPQAALRFILQNEDLSMVLIGMETPQEVREDVLASGGPALGKIELEGLELYTAGWQGRLASDYEWLKDWRLT